MARETASEVGFQLPRVVRLLRRSFDRRAKVYGHSRSRWQLLWLLSKEEGLKQAELAERLDMVPISLARQLDVLEAEQLVERRRDPLDKRCFRIYLGTGAGPVLDQLRPLAEQTREQAFAGLSEAELNQLNQLLTRVHNNLSQEEGEQ